MCLYATSDLGIFNNINIFKNLSNSCVFGVTSVSIVLFTSNIPHGKFVEVNKSCDSFDSSKSVFFVTHGFLAHSYWPNFNELTSLLLEKDCTIFVLDWSNAACYNDPTIINLLAYPFAVRNTREVGDYLASYVKSVMNVCNVPLKKITLIGHSLGAHISSFAAKNLQKSNYGKIPLLIGTDPAGPSFMFRDCEDRFCKTDAKRVVALHSSFIFGIQKSIAHLDLWFNNGNSQPACHFLEFNCSHNIAVDYLAHTLLDNCVYVGVPISVMPGCSSNITKYIVVNSNLFNDSYSIIGDYCVSVTSKYPYCKKKEKLYEGKDLRIL
ncbi:putative phospholipase A1 magnifin [Cyphomyrmex costatus]|uniref:phospholipase A1 n=1 Tax=Cyphomyrmex costatus TaxID=456900 RepID=A0A151IQT6_9HYME|nr:putative phospholipase A1 magnifin [Cyphomyrmex costatus]